MSLLDTQVDQYLNYLVVEKGLAAKTIESYSRDLVKYLDFLKQLGITDITGADTAVILKHLLALRDSGLGARSRARHLVSLRGFYKYLAQEKLGTIMLGIFKKLFWCVSFDNATEIHEHDPVGHTLGKTHFVGNHDHGHAFLCKINHDVQHFLDHLRIQR